MGKGPSDTRELTLALGVEMLLLGGVSKKAPDAKKKLEAALADGSGLERLARMAKAQGGDPKTIHDPSLLPRAKQRVPSLRIEQVCRRHRRARARPGRSEHGRRTHARRSEGGPSRRDRARGKAR